MFYINAITLPSNKPYYQLIHKEEGYFRGFFSKSKAYAMRDMHNSRLYHRAMLRDA